MFQTFHLRKFLTSLGLTLATGFLAGILSGGESEVYGTLVKPPFSPPGSVFPVVWAILYVLMGVSLYMIRTLPDSARKRSALLIFVIQLFFNFCWPIAFFRFNLYCFSALWLAILIVLIGITIYDFYKLKPIAGLLLVPYIIWCSYALYLNIGTCILN